MDGDEKTHNLYRLDADGAGTFAQTARAAETLAAHGVDFNILCVVNKDVCARPAETYEALRRYRFRNSFPVWTGWSRARRRLRRTRSPMEGFSSRPSTATSGTTEGDST